MEHSSITSASNAALLAGTSSSFRQKLDELISVLHDIPEQSEAQPNDLVKEISHEQILGLLKARRARVRYFPEGLFADPAWDILLELYAAKLGNRRISVSSACIGADVPATTALRWIAILERNLLVSREDDPRDGRRVYLNLTELGASAISDYFKNTRGVCRGI